MAAGGLLLRRAAATGGCRLFSGSAGSSRRRRRFRLMPPSLCCMLTLKPAAPPCFYLSTRRRWLGAPSPPSGDLMPPPPPAGHSSPRSLHGGLAALRPLAPPLAGDNSVGGLDEEESTVCATHRLVGLPPPPSAVRRGLRCLRGGARGMSPLVRPATDLGETTHQLGRCCTQQEDSQYKAGVQRQLAAGGAAAAGRAHAAMGARGRGGWQLVGIVAAGGRSRSSVSMSSEGADAGGGRHPPPRLPPWKYWGTPHALTAACPTRRADSSFLVTQLVRSDVLAVESTTFRADEPWRG